MKIRVQKRYFKDGIWVLLLKAPVCLYNISFIDFYLLFIVFLCCKKNTKGFRFALVFFFISSSLKVGFV